MILASTFLKEISYREMVESLVDVMAANFEDFAAEYAHFRETIAQLESQQEDGASVSEMLEAMEQQIGSRLVFSFFLGLKANLDHYHDPVCRTFIDIDPEIYLRENVAQQLPDYQNAKCIQKKFYTALTAVQQEMYEDISSYISYLETVGPKLAHYYGYIQGNKLFPHIIPGYVEDRQLTLRYSLLLEDYFAIKMRLTFVN